jgi:cell wall-associated NlpC family hydrolase
MTYVDGLTSALSQVGQIETTISSPPQFSAGSDFDAVLDNISSIANFLAPSAPAGAAAPAMVGWPFEEGGPLVDQATGGDVAALDVAASGQVTATDEVTGSGEVAAAVTGGELSGTSAASGSETTATGAAGAALGQAVVADTEKYLGIPYQWGGTNPSQGLDCSGLVQDVFADVGISLPRTSQEQALVGTPVASLAAAQPGDLVFFPGTDGTASAPGHVGIYIGNDEMIDAPYEGANVRVDPVGDPTAIRRVTGLAQVSGAATTTASSGAEQGTGPAGESSPAGESWPTGEASAVEGSQSAYAQDFTSAATSSGVPSALLQAVASTESGCQTGAVSSAGAEGLMQLMPTTAASIGVDPFNPAQAIRGAASLLSSYYNRFGSWPLALAAYNAGPAAVETYGGIPPYPQTEEYVQTVLGRAGIEPL